jgi:predicted DNA-binding transcriptional regulator YafY
VALLATRRVFDPLRGSALFDEIDLALREIEQVAHRPTSRGSTREATTDARLEGRFAYAPLSPRAYPDRTEDVDVAFRALSELRVLRFRYRDGASDERAGRGARITAHAYALVLQGGCVSCVAYDVDRRAARAFALERMSDLEVSEGERFDLPADFALSEWLQGDFGVAQAAATLKLLVEFDPRVADAVRARRVHPSQKLAVAPDGRVRASLVVPESPEVFERVRTWVLSFGASARVLEPRQLADEVALELRRAASRYA